MKTDKILDKLNCTSVLVKNDDEKAFKRIFGHSGWNGVLPSFAIIERGNVQYLYSSISYFINDSLAVNASFLSPDYKTGVQKGVLCAFFHNRDYYHIGYYKKYRAGNKDYPHISDSEDVWRYAMTLEGDETVNEIGMRIMRYFED